MSQVTDFITPGSPLTMLQLAAFLDGRFDALLTISRGSSAPSNPAEGMLWWDSTSADEVLKRYTVTAGWVSVLTVNRTTGSFTVNGALMDSELTSEASVKALNQGVATTDSPSFAGATVTSSSPRAMTVVSTSAANNDVVKFETSGASASMGLWMTQSDPGLDYGVILRSSGANLEIYTGGTDSGGRESCTKAATFHSSQSTTLYGALSMSGPESASRIYLDNATYGTSDVIFYQNNAGQAVIGHNTVGNWASWNAGGYLQLTPLSGNTGIQITTSGAAKGLDLVHSGSLPGIALDATGTSEVISLGGDASEVRIGAHDAGGSGGAALNFYRGGADGFDTYTGGFDASGNFRVDAKSSSHSKRISASNSVDRAFIETHVKSFNNSFAAYTTVLTITPSAVTNVFTQGVVKAIVTGDTSAVGNGSRTSTWRFSMGGTPPTVAIMGTDVTEGVGALRFQLAVSGNSILVQVSSSNGTNSCGGVGVFEIIIPNASGTAATFTIT